MSTIPKTNTVAFAYYVRRNNYACPYAVQDGFADCDDCVINKDENCGSSDPSEIAYFHCRKLLVEEVIANSKGKASIGQKLIETRKCRCGLNLNVFKSDLQENPNAVFIMNCPKCETSHWFNFENFVEVRRGLSAVVNKIDAPGNNFRETYQWCKCTTGTTRTSVQTEHIDYLKNTGALEQLNIAVGNMYSEIKSIAHQCQTHTMEFDVGQRAITECLNIIAEYKTEIALLETKLQGEKK